MKENGLKYSRFFVCVLVYLKLLVGGPNGDEIWCCCSYEDIKKVIMKAMK
jgi:hypothetical protein